LRVAERASQLYLDGWAPLLIFSGGLGNLTQGVFTKPEADLFLEVALNMGVPKEHIIVENKSTNTGENIRFTYQILQDKNIALKKMILVQKPYMERRTYATFKKQWPDAENVEIIVTSPKLDYDEYFTTEIPKQLVLNTMIGDLQRVREYPKKGFQIYQEIPDDIWEAYTTLVNEYGYSDSILKS